ncbi:MAG: hypothetical protein P4L61_04095, partial [Candidatus Pacebacteria bacterium]|nr:hypothetical protein [Candidatus Paceibacterota bacterium]
MHSHKNVCDLETEAVPGLAYDKVRSLTALIETPRLSQATSRFSRKESLSIFLGLSGHGVLSSALWSWPSAKPTSRASTKRLDRRQKPFQIIAVAQRQNLEPGFALRITINQPAARQPGASPRFHV